MSAGRVVSNSPTLPALLAGASLGLVVGAASLGIITATGSAGAAITNGLGFLLAGYLFLFTLGLVIGWPLLGILRHRGLKGNAMLAAVAGGGIVAAVVLSLVLGWITNSVWNSLLAVVPATLCCLVPALALAQPLSRRPRIVSTVIIVVSIGAVVAAVYYLVRFVAA